ncbi:hypothetical protein VTI74DRAFT_3275 [Chaetomium olivicolor]
MANSSQDTLFSYDSVKLPSASTHIRLLHLHPSPAPSSPLICSLTIHPLHSSHSDSYVPNDDDDNPPSGRPKFTAVSYAWGPGDRTAHASVNGDALLLITPSLDTALRHLRHAEDVLTLWIDQVCIDQSCDDEKSAQVVLMGRIFRAAEEVVVWLGPAADGSDELMEVFREVGLEASELGLQRYLNPEGVGLLRPIIGEEVLDENHHMMMFRELLFESAPRFRRVLKALVEWNRWQWFGRVWVVQEFALATRWPVLVCGGKRVSAGLVFLAITVYGLVGGELLRDGPLKSQSRMDAEQWIREVRLPLSQLANLRLDWQVFESGLGLGNPLLALLRRMYEGNKMDATDERDRIFALLALACDADKLGLKPDYSVDDCGPLFVRVARALIQTTGRLEVLSCSQFPKASYHRLTTPLPICAADWRSDLHICAIETISFWAGMVSPEPDCETIQKGVHYTLEMDEMDHKAPFMSKKGYVGLGPPKMMPGDMIVIFAGAHIPYVLRPSVDRDKHWEYVGEAYCDGVMDGEVWDESKLETFYLFDG